MSVRSENLRMDGVKFGEPYDCFVGNAEPSPRKWEGVETRRLPPKSLNDMVKA